MDKLTIRELAPYLPYRVKINTPNGIRVLKGTDTAAENVIGLLYWIDTKQSISFSIDCKLLLHPLSSLTKEIEVNGERFVPIEQLDLYHNFSIMHFSDIHKDPTRYPYTIVEKLFEWGFDVFGLIDRNLAIDKTTITP